MKKTTLLLSVIFLILLSPLSIKAEEPLEAKKMTTLVNVTETGKMEVTQEIEMMFNQPHRGIYVTIPQTYKDVKINEKLYDFYMPLENVRVLSNDPAELDSDSQGTVIRIGNPDIFLEGEKTYTYAYDIQMYPWTGTETDIFYMDLISDQWDFPIHQNDFEITFPEDVSNEVFIYASKDNRPVDFSVEANVIKGSFMGTLDREALTVETKLGDNYFNYPKSDYSNYILVGQGLFIALLTLLYFKFGKDYHVVDSVEFTAPDGLSSADTGYVYRGLVSNDDVISLIIYWASKGYLIIEELGKNEMQMTKVRDMTDDYPAEERRLFNSMFSKGDVANTKTLSNKFGVTLQNAKQAIPQSFSSNPERRIFERTGIGFKYVLAFIMPVISAMLFGSFIYANVPSLEYAIPYAILGLVSTTIFLVLGMYVFDNAKDGRPFLFKIFYFVGFALINGFLLVTVFSSNALRVQIIFVIHAIFVLFAIIMLANMSRRTEQGARWYGQILGLKRFIETAEKDRLEMLAEETPTIFYDILPFAFVLGVTDVWSKKFRDIKIDQPDWYRTQGGVNFTSMYMWSSLNRSINTMRPAMTSVPAPTGKTGGGGSFGGGGGFGGGGSSGGGFGGSGGGGW